jgi:16S rRNA (adenine1518-N6/adenine1519-N6)-dimethyltransferase
VKKFNKKSLGQNFLFDKNIIKKIINLVEIEKKNIIEIGPGEGALTDEIIKQKPKLVYCIEKDNFLSKKLNIKYSQNKNVQIINADILKFNLEKLKIDNSIIFGNLPYNISSQILVKILNFKKWPPNYSDVIFMFQKELGEKILGKFQTKNYGRISILSNYRLLPKTKFIVSPNCFFPKPKVDSIIIHFKPKLKNFSNIKNMQNLEKVTNILFSNKRKIIKKNIKKILDQKKIKQLNFLNLGLRPSEIKPDDYYKITELFEKG